MRRSQLGRDGDLHGVVFMLLPEFTIRNLFGITFVCGVFFSVVAYAVRGASWAVGITAPVLIVAGTLVLQMATYVLAYRLGELRLSSPADLDNPFAEDSPSAQVIPPEEREW